MTTDPDPPSPGDAPTGASPGPFRRRFWPLFLLGLPGVATLPLVVAAMLAHACAHVGFAPAAWAGWG